MNSLLAVTFTREEVEKALKQMAPLKFPGLDGFNPNFYQTYWHIVRGKITAVVLKFLNDGCFDSSINFIYIALIPKIKNPMLASDFYPISLCNAIYKIMSKVLANILKMVLPSIILKNQSAFIPGRLIINNIIVAYEALYSMKKRKKKDVKGIWQSNWIFSRRMTS